MKTLPRLFVPAVVAGMCACGTHIGSDEGVDLAPPPTIGGPSSGGGFVGGGTFGGAVSVGPSGRPLRLTDLRTAASPPPAISGGTLAVASDGKQIIAADPDRDTVFLINAETLDVRSVALPAGSEPGRVALDRTGVAHVALRGTGKLVRIDPAGSIANETDVCTQPRGVTYDAANDAVVTACLDGQLVSLAAATHQELERQTFDRDLRDVVINTRGERMVSRYRSAELLSLSGGDIKATARPAKARHFSFRPVPTTPGFSGPNVQPGTVTLSPALAWRALPTQQGGVLMLHQQSQDDEVVVSAGGYGSGCQTITSGAVTQFSPDGEPTHTMGVSLMGLSVDAAASPDAQWLALASPGAYVNGSGTIQIYPLSSMAAVEAEPPPTGDTPSVDGGIVGGFTGGGFPGMGCAFPTLMAGHENQTVAVAFDGAGLLYALSREPAEVQIYEVKSVAPVNGFSATSVPVLQRKATIALSTRSVRDTGHDLFHADVGQGLACASCHGEALDDGHVWNFQKIGPRRTQNMRGGLLKTAPFHWDGDMGSIGHLVEDVMTGRMGGFPVESSFSAALGNWIDQQPAIALPVADAAAVTRGKALFESSDTKCATCHFGPNLTNNLSYDVGTGGSFQVPALLGLAQRAPFMHDGCAKTLDERFDAECGGGDAHGKTSHLSAAQRADLVSYLSSL